MKPKVYLASPLGFSEPGRLWSAQVLLPAIISADLEPADPWSKPGTELSGAPMTIDANMAIGRANEEMIRASDAMLALLDGTEVDSGTAAELGFAYAIGLPIVGLRTDFRIAIDNPAARANIQLEFWIRESGGDIVASLDEATAALVGLLT